MQTLDDLIDELGGMGRYQIIILLFTECCRFTVGWSMLQMSFSGFIPDFDCLLPGTNSSAPMNDSLNACSVNGSDCADYYYHGSAVTIVTEWDLVCDRKWIKSTVTSIQMGGVLAGGVVFAQLSDTFGRRKIYYSLVVLHILANIMAAFSLSWEMFAASRFLTGAFAGSILVVGVAYTIEFMPMKWRPIVNIMPTWSFSVALLAATAYVFHNWFHLHIACAILSAPSLLTFPMVPESVRWLAVHGRIEEAQGVLETMARINKTTVPLKTKEVLENVLKIEQKSQGSQHKYTYLDLFKTWHLVKTTVIIWFTWFTFSTVFYGISFGVSSLGGNLYLNIFLLAMVEMPLTMATLFFNNKFGRRYSSMGFTCLSCLAAAGCLISHLFAPDDIRDSCVTGLSLVADMMNVASWACVATILVESFPTVIRNLGIGLVGTGSRLGGILSPFIIDLDNRVVVSYSLMTGLLFICCFLVFFLSETKGVALADSMEKATNVSEPNGEIEMSDVTFPRTETQNGKS